MHIEITPGQRELLLELVNDEVNELGPEIHHTTRQAYREDLRDRRRVLLSLRALLAPGEEAELTADTAS